MFRVGRLLLLAACLLPLVATALDYTSLQSETSLLRDRFSRGKIDSKTYCELLQKNTEKLGFEDVNVHLLKQDLAKAKKQEPPELSSFFERVDALAAQEKLQRPAAVTDKERLTKILRRPEFVLEEKPRIWEALLLRVLEFLRNLFGNAPLAEPLFLISRIITVICLVGLIGILAYLIWRYTRAPALEQLPSLEVLS